MSDTLKTAGASCPKCHAHCPAEYAQMGQPPRWTCHGCGAGGPLTGEFAGRASASSAPPAPVKKHWRQR